MSQDNMRTVFNLTRFEMQYPDFIREIAPKIANDEILKPIKKRMKDFGYSKKIIDSTRFENLQLDNFGNLEFDVVSDYKSDDGFDVAKAREEGTVDHFIKPVTRKALSFILQGATGLISSFRAFSKGHWVRGITASNVITKTIEEFTPIAQQRLNEETDNFLNRSLGN